MQPPITRERTFKGKLFRWFDQTRTKKEAQAKVRRLKRTNSDILFRIMKQEPRGGWNIYTKVK